MAVTVFTNTIGMPNKRADIEAAVRAGIENRPGDQLVEILADPARAGFQINICGPDLNWSRRFETPDEERTEYVRKIIEAENGPEV